MSVTATIGENGPKEFHHEAVVTGKKAELVVQSHKFLDWASGFDVVKYKVNSIDVEATLFTPGGDLLFASINVDITDRSKPKRFVPGYIFLRGHAVAVLTILRNTDQSIDYVFLVEQFRAPMGFSIAELPAGMLEETDRASGELQFSNRVIEELDEEGTLRATSKNLFYMGKFAPSPGGSDEIIYLYRVVFHMTTAEIQAFLDNPHIGGVEEEGEDIKARIVQMNDILEAARFDGKAYAAYAIYLKKRLFV